MNSLKVNIDSLEEIKAIDIFPLIENSDWLFLDVRHNFERSGGYLPGLHIPLENITERSIEIPRDKNIIVYCRCGNRSGTAIEQLIELGFKNKLVNLIGGMMAVKRKEWMVKGQ